MTVRANKPAFSIREKLKELDYAHVPYEKMPAGSVIQVVRGWTQTVDTSTAADTYRDTGLESTINLKFKNSKILIIVTQSIGALGNGTSSLWADIRLQKTVDGVTSTIYANTSNSTVHALSTFYIPGPDFNYGEHSFTEIDSPNTLNSITYKTQYTISSSGGGQVRAQPDAASSTMILMEIVQ